MLDIGCYRVTIKIDKYPESNDNMISIDTLEYDFDIKDWLDERSKLATGVAIDNARDEVLRVLFSDAWRADHAPA